MNRFITLICFKVSCAGPENAVGCVCVCVCVGGGGTDVFLFVFSLVIKEFLRGPYEPPPRSNCFSRESVPVFLRTTIATSDFPGEGVRTHVPTSGSAHRF